MTSQVLMISIGFALLLGASVAVLVWSLKGSLLRRWQKDVAWLEHAIWRFTPQPFNARPYVAAYYVVSLLVLVLLWILFPVKLVALIVWGALLIVPRIVIEWKWEKQRKLIDRQLAEAVLQMSTSVASGMTLVQAIERLTERCPDPIRTEFRIMSNQWRLGADLQSTIEEAKQRLNLPNFNLFASALLINQRMGGNVVTTLERLAFSVEGIERMRQEVRAATAEGRMNVKVLAVSPVIMLGLSCFIDAGAVGMLFTTPVGLMMLGASIALTALGTFWAWRIVGSDV